MPTFSAKNQKTWLHPDGTQARVVGVIPTGQAPSFSQDLAANPRNKHPNPVITLSASILAWAVASP